MTVEKTYHPLERPYTKSIKQYPHVKLSNDEPFGNQNAPGVQHKGIVLFQGDPYFAKLDTLNPAISGEWKPYFDYYYSSVAESITSCFVHNMKPDPDFQSVDYEFAIFEHPNGEVTTGTLSDLYLSENEVERPLATDRSANIRTAMTINEYAEIIVDTNASNRLAKLVNISSKYGVKTDKAKHFFVQQAGFDMMMGNMDRLNNPGNFILIQNVATNDAHLVNFDYGRCLQNMWTEGMEERYDVTSDYHDETVEDTVSDFVHSNDSIVSSLSNKDAIAFLQDEGFQPFELNRVQLEQDLDDLKQVIQDSSLPFPKFASLKIDAMKELVNSDFAKQFYVDISSELEIEKTTELDTDVEVEPT